MQITRWILFGFIHCLPMILARSKNGTAPLWQKAQMTTLRQCGAHFGDRGMLSAEQSRNPPVLYSYPGSGNTWCRLLIEHATGIQTGSIYNDPQLAKMLPGEFLCNRRVSVVKIHPNHYNFSRITTGNFVNTNKCAEGGVSNFTRLILLYRNPYDAIWSEYQRSMSVGHGHVGSIQHNNFHFNHWKGRALGMAKEYLNMWTKDVAGLQALLPKLDILYVRYENLLDAAKREATLMRLVKFLDLPITTSSPSPVSFPPAIAKHEEDNSNSSSDLGGHLPGRAVDTLSQRVNCAFVLSEATGAAHRAKSSSFLRRVPAPPSTASSTAGSPSSPPSNAVATTATLSRVVEVSAVTKDRAYPAPLVCAMWEIFGSVVKSLDYVPYKNASCGSI